MTRILVIDDERVVRSLMVEILQERGYDVVGAETAHRALELLRDGTVSLVVSDIVMPGLTGLELLEEIHAIRPGLPVVMVTGAGTHANISEALARGAAGLVTKPFTHAELVNAVVTAVERARRTEDDFRERLLAPTLAGALANAIEARETSLSGHCERLAELAMRLAIRVGLGERELETVRLGAILHDVGKIGIPDRVLMKPGPFTPEELALMRTHPLIGDALLEPLDLFADVRAVVRHHHERWDGRGYPAGLAGEGIPLAARIVAVADAVEAMSAQRPYRATLTRAEIVHELELGRATQWDPRLTDDVLELIRDGTLQFDPEGLRIRELSGLERPAGPSPCSILLVESDAGAAQLAKEALEGGLANVSVSHAPDAATAAELCRDSSWSLVVLDDRLPDGAGLELLERLAHEQPELPIVMLTAAGEELLAVEAFRLGAADYVIKANGYLGELTGRVRSLLGTAAACGR